MNERALGRGKGHSHNTRKTFTFATTPRAVSDEVNDDQVKCALTSVFYYRNVANVAKQAS